MDGMQSLVMAQSQHLHECKMVEHECKLNNAFNTDIAD